tara:strand:- start:17432 stop:18076 length:645 start_codon:yes stop_codon:yes gene_type:complete
LNGIDSYRGNNTRNIYTLDLNTDELIQLTELETRDGHPVWSSDCRRIAFQSSRNGNPDVYIMVNNVENVMQLTYHSSFDGIPKWSPDNKFIAFNSRRTGSPNVFLLNVNTKEEIQLTNDGKFNFIQDWLTDTELLFITDVDEKRQLQTLDIKKNTVKDLPTDFDVTYARSNMKGNIILSQKNMSDEIHLYSLDLNSLLIKKIFATNGEKGIRLL